MSRRLVLTAIVASATVVLTACGGNSKPHTQSYSASPTDPPSSSSARSSSSASASTSPPPTTTSSDQGPIATPTVTAPAQTAVNAYIALQNALTAASRDPAHADLSAVNKYLSGKAETLFDGSLAAMGKAGQAYRGTPASPRVKVLSVVSDSFVYLTSCPLASTSDPFIRYTVSTGKPVPVPTENPPPPYLATLSMKRVGDQWQLTDYLQNVGATCTG